MMQRGKQVHLRVITLQEFRTICWPVKIRVRAAKPLLAPRWSPIFPASHNNLNQPDLVLRAIEVPPPRPRRRTKTVPA